MVICDEVTALGWRLSGARALVADEHSLHELFAQARDSTDLLLITPELASRLPSSVLDTVLLAEKPLIAMIAGQPGTREEVDLEQEVKHVLGIAL